MQKDMTSIHCVADVETGEETSGAGQDFRSGGIESIQTGHDDASADGMEKPGLGELQAAADEFNAAFNMALRELEFTRRELGKRAVRIDELDEALVSIKRALDDEVDRGRGREDEYTRETEALRQQIHAAESERDNLRQKVCEQEKSLDDRSGEIHELSARVADLNATLEESAAAAARNREEFASERDALSGRLGDLQALHEEAERRLNTQQQELEAGYREITSLKDQVANLLAEIESKDDAAARLDRQVTQLQGEIDAQTESIRAQSESHALACEELNARISGVSAELETLRVSHNDLQAHAGKLENLNQALHESSVTEKTVHKQQLDDKATEIESLSSRLESANESLKARTDSTAEAAGLNNTVHELEARLQEVEAQNQELNKKANESDRIEKLNGRLRAALQKAREHVRESSGESQDVQLLREQLAELRAELDSACSREKELADKLRANEALEQELERLRVSASGIDGGQPVDEAGAGTVEELKREVDNLVSALSASEEKCRQLEAACSRAVTPDEAGVVLQVVPDVRQDVAAPGRTRLVSRLERLLDEKGGPEKHHSLMYILLDNFISIRDEIGLMESESVVKDVVKTIDVLCGKGDMLERFGDCTFAILCTDATMDDAEEKAGRIRTAVEGKIFEYGGRSLVTTTSIGICSVRSNDVEAENIISRADLACEAARLSGGNRVIVSSAVADEMTVTGSNEDHEEMVRSTLAENRIKTYYQPISSLREQSVNNFEVLVRLVDESGDMILPGEFFAMAEATGYADKVDRYVIENTIKVISESPEQQVTYFIKLTRQSVADTGLSAWITQKIEEYDVRPEHLVFEIAEKVMQGELKNLALLSNALNAIGCKVAIEHYRMSTNLQHLKHVHADYLKIDKGLVGSVDDKGGSLAKVTAILELARNNDYITIAEGVESPGCLAILWELGVCMAQGYFIQAPAPDREYADNDISTDTAGNADGKARFIVS
jgi:diguanylate cyclase (GGDEF)-like protein